MKRYIHKIQSVKVFVLKSQFLNRCTLNSSKLMNMYGIVTFLAKIQWKMSGLVGCGIQISLLVSAVFQMICACIHAYKNIFTEQFVQYRILKKTYL